MLPGAIARRPRIPLAPRHSRRMRLNAERPAAIRAVCPFRLAADEDMDQLDREITMSDAATGSTLFEEGDPAAGVAAILEGSVEILKGGRVLATLGPGSVLGELSVFVTRSCQCLHPHAPNLNVVQSQTDSLDTPEPPPPPLSSQNDGAPSASPCPEMTEPLPAAPAAATVAPCSRLCVALRDRRHGASAEGAPAARGTAEPPGRLRPHATAPRRQRCALSPGCVSRVELRGLEPLTLCMPCRCATSCATAPVLPEGGSPADNSRNH